eukprot:CAMPEP_0172780840 /NCGR_PEP_ID=MMETSP1074-20121228/203129_1 /TAXON_ID=2916 /ORGANISM="Ceratium fusus, Strain PA161109" /LENGTH=98 /DNA_ID=CAMNT_0013617817 /DNA_START=1423 /DNA_END=1719 /DNA_ORIENTATION=+
MASCHERPNEPHRSGGSIAATSAHQLSFFTAARSLLLCFGTCVAGTFRGEGGGDRGVVPTAGAVAARGRLPVKPGLHGSSAGHFVIRPAGSLDRLRTQ